MKVDCNKITIEYQKFEMVHDTHTYTDIEIYDDSNFHIILEAKRGWNLPKTSYTVTYCFVSPLIFSWFYAVFRYRTNDCIIGKFQKGRSFRQ